MKELEIIYLGNDYDPKKGKDEEICCKFKIKYSVENLEIKERVKAAMEFMGKIGINNNPSFRTTEDEEIFELIITGRGKDGRCIKCRSFRTTLRNLLLKNKIKLKQKSFCKFDREEGYGIYLIEELENRIKMYEIGMDNENAEEDYRGWKEKLIELNKLAEEEAFKIGLIDKNEKREW